jgi:hypothetical protein
MTLSHSEYPSYSESSFDAQITATPETTSPERHLSLVPGLVEIEDTPQEYYKYKSVQASIPPAFIRQWQMYNRMQADAYEAQETYTVTDERSTMARLRDEMNSGFYKHKNDPSSYDQGIAHV